MQIIKFEFGYAQNTYIVKLTKEQETLTDGELIDGVHSNNRFGGRVERRRGRKTTTMYAKVVAYTD